jgi:glycosyltransferase involved in cell wall biosynthesis
MKILVWCPFVNLGGGIRLLMRLVPAMAQNHQVKAVRLVVPSAAYRAHNLTAHQSGKLEITTLKGSSLRRLMQSPAPTKPTIFKNRFTTAFWRRVLPPWIGRIEARQLWEQSRDFDVVYVFWPHGRPYHLAQKPVVCTYQDTTFLDFPEILGARATLTERSYAVTWMENATHIVVSSQTSRNRLVHHFGRQFSTASVIYHNILPEAPTPCSTNVKVSDQLPARYILYPANTNPHKNHDILLVAWSRLARRKEFPLVLVGEGTQILSKHWDIRHNWYWQQDRLVGLTERLGLKRDEDLFALGYVSDAQLTALLRQAYALIMPTLSEGGGSYPVEEALFYGIPVLASNIPVLREHLSMRSAEISWFDPLSVDSIVNALDELLDRYDVYKQSAVSAMKDVRPTWSDVATQYIAVFSQFT